MKISFCQFLLCALVLSGGDGFAGGLRNFPDSWPIDSIVARGLLLKPQKLGEREYGFQIMAGQGRLFEMPDLDQRFLAFEGRLANPTFNIAGGGHWERTGSALFAEDQLEGHIQVGQSPTWGLWAHLWHQSLGGFREASEMEWGLLWGLPFQLGEIKGSIQLEWPLSVSSQGLGGRRRRNILNLTLANNVVAASLVLDRQDDGTPRPGFHFLLAVGRGVGWEFRADPATGSLGPGLTFVRGKMMLRTSHVVHPHLGVTHRLMLVMGPMGGGP